MKIVKALSLVAFIMLLCSCDGPVPGPEPEKPQQPQQPVEETAFVKLESGQSTSVSVGYEKTEFPVSFSTNKNWTADITFGSEVSGWVSLSPKSGSAGNHAVIVNVSANSENFKRTAVIAIKAGDESVSIVISQDAFTSEFSISPQKIEVAAEGGTIEVSVTSNIGYHISTSVDWIHEMGTKATQTKSIWFIVDANTSSSSRSGVIVICNDNEVCIPVEVTQDGSEQQDEDPSSEGNEGFENDGQINWD